MNKISKITWLLLLAIVCVPALVNAQSISAGIDGAANQVKNSFTSVSNLILMVGGIVGLAGGIRVYQKWNNGDHDINKELVGWGGSAVFLLLAGTTLKLFFGI